VNFVFKLLVLVAAFLAMPAGFAWSQPSLAKPIPAQFPGAAGIDLDLTEFFTLGHQHPNGIKVDSSLGSILLEMLSADAPGTVRNFLSYVDDGSYENIMVHRSVPGFVIQTGGFKANASAEKVATKPPVTNEFRLSNLRGTVAMARVGGQTNSATSQWFVNLADNTSLDTVDGGFTVFARVSGQGMGVVDAISALPVVTNFAPPFNELPLRGLQPGQTNLAVSNFVSFRSVSRFPFRALSSNPDAWSVSLSLTNRVLSLRPGPLASRSATITVWADDLEGRTAETSFVVQPAPARAYAELVPASGGPVLVSMTVLSSGAFSGTASAPAGTRRLRGIFDRTGAKSTTIELAAGLSAALRYDPSLDRVLVTPAGGESTPLRPRAWGGEGTDVSPFSGKSANALLDRGGSGYFQMVFDSAGTARLRGLLSDGSKMSGSFPSVLGEVPAQPDLPLLLAWKSGSSARLSGTLGLSTDSISSGQAISGSLSRTPRAGSPLELAVAGAFWAAPGSGQAIEFRLQFESVGLTGLPASPVGGSWSPPGKPLLSASSPQVSLKVSASSGEFSGKVGKAAFRGALTGPLPDLGAGFSGGGFAGRLPESSPVVVLRP